MKLPIRRGISPRVFAWTIGGLSLVTLLMVARALNNTQVNSLYASYQGCSKNYDGSLHLCWKADGNVVDIFQDGGLVIHKNFLKHP